MQLDQTIGKNRLGSARDHLPQRSIRSIPHNAFGGQPGIKPVRKNVARRLSSSLNRKLTFYSSPMKFIGNFESLLSRLDREDPFAAEQIRANQRAIRTYNSGLQGKEDPYRNELDLNVPTKAGYQDSNPDDVRALREQNKTNIKNTINEANSNRDREFLGFLQTELKNSGEYYEPEERQQIRQQSKKDINKLKRRTEPVMPSANRGEWYEKTTRPSPHPAYTGEYRQPSSATANAVENSGMRYGRKAREVDLTSPGFEAYQESEARYLDSPSTYDKEFSDYSDILEDSPDARANQIPSNINTQPDQTIQVQEPSARNKNPKVHSDLGSNTNQAVNSRTYDIPGNSRSRLGRNLMLGGGIAAGLGAGAYYLNNRNQEENYSYNRKGTATFMEMKTDHHATSDLGYALPRYVRGTKSNSVGKNRINPNVRSTGYVHHKGRMGNYSYSDLLIANFENTTTSVQKGLPKKHIVR